MISKMAALAVQGKVGDMFSISTPAQIHHHLSHLNLAANDSTYANFLTQANNDTTDPVDKMKLVAAFMIASHYVNPTMT